ncbi:MAG: sarcosine oxidase subunit delta [Vicinamibacterales bacterium]
MTTRSVTRGARAWIPCPHCGARPVEEFVYGEVPTPPDTLTDADARDVDRAFMRSNLDGPVVERWFHVGGCRRWVTLRRDTRTNDAIEAS